MATVKKSKKKIIVPISIILVIAIVAGCIFGITKSKSGEEVKLNTISTGDIYEKVSLTGDVTAGTSKDYKVGTVATVKSVNVKVGDQVKKGDVLATFDTTSLDSQVSSLQTSYNDALKNYNNAVKNQKTANNKASTYKKQIDAIEKRLQSLIRKLLKRQLLKRRKQQLLKLRLRQAQLTVFHSGLQLPQLKQQLLPPLLQLQLSLPQMMAHRSIQ